MKPSKLAYCIAFLYFASVNAVSETTAPVTFKAIYKLYAGSIVIAESERIVSSSGPGIYTYHSESHTAGLAALFHKDHVTESSKWKFIDKKLVPTEYSYFRTGGKKSKKISILFDWEKKTLFNQYNESKIELPLQDGMLDKLSYQYAIMYDLQNNQLPEQYTVADARKIKTYNLKTSGEEVIKTPLGELHTVKISKVDDDSNVVIWCAPEYKFLPVKIMQTEEDGQVITTVIQKIEGI